MSEPGLLTPGEPGAGGYYAVWDEATEEGAGAAHVEFQYAGMAHQADAALSGMWLFLAQELLFFGGLFLVYAITRATHPAGFAEASRHAELAIGTVNTALLLTSSAVFAYAVGQAREGRNRAVFWSSLLTAALGLAFLLLKAYEWRQDFAKHLFPDAEFAIGGPDTGSARLFWCFYFVATALHMLHMLVGIGLLGWIARDAWRERFSRAYNTPVEVVGLYWSFVDMIWMLLYPMIYLAGGVAR